jgi:predicted aldo/keto reductase-like oxidoreductase
MTTKSLARTREAAEKELETSLRTLKTDHVDLWQIHNVMTRDDIRKILGPGGAMESFAAAKRAGKCRFIGFSAHHDPEVGLEMLRSHDGFDTILMPLHAADPSYLSFQKTLLPAAVERGLAIQAMKVFGSAVLLRSLSVKECLSYTLSLPVHAAVVGASSRGQWDDNARVTQAFKPLPEDEMKTIQDLATKANGATITGPAMEYWKKR